MKYTHLATRLFGTPLLIERGKLDTIIAVFGQRAGIEIALQGQAAQTYGPGDSAEGRTRKSYYVTEDKIAVIEVIGPLVKRSSGDFLSGGPTTYGEIESEFMDAMNDASIRGILLLVDSPGGESVGAFELSDLIYSQRGTKPVFAVADGDAFSAAFAIASAADRLYVTKSGGVGSVGVWMAHIDQSKFNDKLGVKVTYIFAGARKVDGNPHEPLSEEAYAVFKAEVDRIYDMFVETAARNRSMTEAAVRESQAGLFFGPNATSIGFADEVGTMQDALTALQQRLGSPRTSSISMAASAMTSTKEDGMSTLATDATPAPANTQPTAPAAGEGNQAPAASAAPTSAEEARTATLAYAADVAETCFLAGRPAAAAGFIRAGRPLVEVRSEMQAARVAEDARTPVQPHVLPETSTDSGRPTQTATDPKDSPLIRAVEKLAQAGKEK